MCRFALNIAQSVWRPGSARTRWGSLQVTDTLSGLTGKVGGGKGKEMRGKESEGEGREGKGDDIPLLSDFLATPLQ